ncbi:MAG: flagellar filament capping protein FliD [Pseudomonadales bacterium]|nr:flagellar filament capping protein FliD [Pseudomonadales bacterium]
MASIDYVQALGAGAGFDTKKIVEALVNAERAPTEARINAKIAENEAKISGLGQAVSILNVVKDAAQRLNDAKDFKTFAVSNSQTSAFTASSTTSARAGSNNITVNQIAQEQRSVSNAFASETDTFSADPVTLSLTVGTGTATEISVGTASLQGAVTAINDAGLGVTAEIIDTGVAGDRYRIQLIGETGAEKAFSLTSSDDAISFSSVQTATDAQLNVNGVDFTRSTNVIDDVLTGVSLTLNTVTDGAANLSISQDNNEARANIVDFVTIYNEAQRQLKELSNSSVDGALAGDSIFRALTSSLRSIVLGSSSSASSSISNLSDMGISVSRSGELEVNDDKLDNVLANNYADVVQMFSANTDDQAASSDAVAGLAGDIGKLISNATDSDSYLVSQQDSLANANSTREEELSDLAERMERVEERYNRQFLAMQQIIDQMNSTRDSMKSSFENLPFSNRD